MRQIKSNSNFRKDQFARSPGRSRNYDEHDPAVAVNLIVDKLAELVNT
jgi:hypothetical protein